MEKVWCKNYQEGVPFNIETEILDKWTLIHLFDDAQKKYSFKNAFHCMGTNLTFDEVDFYSRSFATHLQSSLGLKVGDRVAIMMPNILQYPIAILGILRAGMIVVNVNPLYTARELEHQLKDSGAKAIVIFENSAHILEKIIDNTSVKYVYLTKVGDSLNFPKKYIVNFFIKYIKKLVPPYSLTYSKALVMDFLPAILSTDASHYQKPHINSESVAFLQYTGGTTGVSKGAMLTHRNIMANVFQAKGWLSSSIDEGRDIIISPLPLYHIFSLTVSIIFFCSGSLNVLITNPKDIPLFVRELKKWKFTVITGVNTLFNSLLSYSDFKNVDFSALKISLGGGMAVLPSTAEKWQKITGSVLLEAYGLTETSPAVCVNPLNLKEYNGAIGLPLPSTDVKILDENKKIVINGNVGELAVKGPQVMKGYWNRLSETKDVMTADGYLLTGDMATIDDAGFVRIVDRKKDMILVSGFNVYPNEIEEVLSHHPKIYESAAVGIADTHSGEAVKVFIVRKDQSLTEEEVISFCREQLTNYKVPRVVEFRRELPKSNVGKILRRELRVV